MIGVAHSCRAVLVFKEKSECIHLPTMTPRVKPPHTLVSVLHWLWYCRATLSALANLTLLLGKNTLPFPAFGNLNFVSPPHRRAYTSIPKSCPNIRFLHQQDFFPIRSVTKSSRARFSHENLVEKFKIFVQDFVPIRTALSEISFSLRNLPVRAFDSRAQGFSPPLARQRSSCPPPSPNLVRTHPIENYQALHDCDSAPCLSRATTLPKGTKLELGRGAHLKTPSSANHTAAASQPTGGIAKAASWLHLSRVSPALHPPERPSHTHTPKPGFGVRVSLTDFYDLAGDDVDTFNFPLQYCNTSPTNE